MQQHHLIGHVLARRQLLLGTAVFLTLPAMKSPSPAWGYYIGDVITRWNPDGRTMTLLQPYEYVDPRVLHWPTQAPWTIDGASIPKVFWPVIGPYEDKYRNASVIHDYYCDTHVRRWQDVHHMFYEAMRASGVGEIKAKIMFAAVWWKGPRWSELKPVPPPSCKPADKRAECHGRAALDRLNRMGENQAAILRSDDILERDDTPQGPVQNITRADVQVMQRFAHKIEKENPSLDRIATLALVAAALSLRLADRDRRLGEVIESRDSAGRSIRTPEEEQKIEMEERVHNVVKDIEKR